MCRYCVTKLWLIILDNLPVKVGSVHRGARQAPLTDTQVDNLKVCLQKDSETIGEMVKIVENARKDLAMG